MTDRDEFEAAVRANPRDAVTRAAYADWLDEHDDPELADLHRSLMGPDGAARYDAAVAWLTAFAGRHRDGYDGETEITFAEVVEAGRAWLAGFDHENGWGDDYYTQSGCASLRDEMSDDAALAAFWAAWSAVAGRVVPGDVRGSSPFSCSC